MALNDKIGEIYSSIHSELTSRANFWDIVVRAKSETNDFGDLITFSTVGRLIKRIQASEFLRDTDPFMDIFHVATVIYFKEKDPENAQTLLEEFWENLANERDEEMRKYPELWALYWDGISLVASKRGSHTGASVVAVMGCLMMFLSLGLFFVKWWLGIVAPIVIGIITKPFQRGRLTSLNGCVGVSLLCERHPIFERACHSINLVYDEEKNDKLADFLQEPYVSIHPLGGHSPIHKVLEKKPTVIVEDTLNAISTQKEIINRHSRI